MTLTLDDVRNKRFHRSGPDKVGYATRDVDEFMDSVEDLVAELSESKAHLETQVAALQGSGSAPARIEVTTGKEASGAVVRLVQMATEQAEQLTAEAQQEAATLLEQARRQVEEQTAAAEERTARLRADAEQAAEQVRAEAAARAEELDRSTHSRRTEMEAELAAERNALVATIDQLRAYEEAYRGQLAAEIRRQLSHLESVRSEPTDLPLPDVEPPAPAVPVAESTPADGAPAEAPAGQPSPADRPTSDTPRLDALLGDAR